MLGTTFRPLYSRERPGTQCAGGWVGLESGLDGQGKSHPPTGIRSPDRPARNMSIYLPSQLKCYSITFPFIYLSSHKEYSSFITQQTDLYWPDGSVKWRRDVTDCGLQVAETRRVMPAVYKRDVKAGSTTCDLNTSDPGLRQCTVTFSTHVNPPH